MSLQYLEDFLEYTEELPLLFCQRLTQVRELDLETHNREDHTRQLRADLHLLRRDLTTPKTTEMTRLETVRIADEISDELNRIVELSCEKVRLIASLEEIMCRFNKHLDEETEKFKLEIEADSPGCTQKLEERANQEMLAFIKAVTVEHFSTAPQSSSGGRRSFGQDPSNRLCTHGTDGADIPSLTEREFLGVSGNRRLSAHGTLINEKWKNDVQTQTLSPVRGVRSRFTMDGGGRQGCGGGGGGGGREGSEKRLMHMPVPRCTTEGSLFPCGDSESALPEEEDDTKKYCFCEGLGGGLMVACDNADCVQEWFHADCVGIQCQADIVGKRWYCPSCSEILETQTSVHSVRDVQSVHSSVHDVRSVRSIRSIHDVGSVGSGRSVGSVQSVRCGVGVGVGLGTRGPRLNGGVVLKGKGVKDRRSR